MSVSYAWLSAEQKAPVSSFVVWSEALVFSAVGTADLSSPCVAVVSAHDAGRVGIFSLNLKGSVLERSTDCTFYS